MKLFGVTLVGVTSDNLHKLLLTLALIALLVLARMAIGFVADRVLKAYPHPKIRFWTWQILSLATVALLLIGTISIWVDDPSRLTTAAGLVTAGLAVALQKVVTAFAAYLVILRGRNFQVGDRIAMGGVRGEVIALGFIQTTIMEMGQSPGEQHDAPSVWVSSRQFTGRIVTVTNDKIFDEPVYNYTNEFPYIWEEMKIGVAFRDDRKRAEEIMLDVARKHTLPITGEGAPSLEKLRRHYTALMADVEPRVFMRITDNWVELTVRFLAHARGTRKLKDAMSRDILAQLEEAGIGIASSTSEIVGLPPIRIEAVPSLNIEAAK